MTLTVFGSGSSGNCYSLTDDKGRALILDAGVNPAKSVWKKVLPDSIEAVLVTHEHGDHSKYIGAFEDRFVKVEKPLSMGGKMCMENGIKRFGDFEVITIDLNHDVPCVGYVINHPELRGGPVLYATDTNGIPYRFDSLSLAMVEANYEASALRENVQNGLIEKSRAKRVWESHQSIVQAVRFLTEQVRHIDHILLVHLSSDNANRERFKRQTEQATGVPTDIAVAQMIININNF